MRILLTQTCRQTWIIHGIQLSIHTRPLRVGLANSRRSVHGCILGESSDSLEYAVAHFELCSSFRFWAANFDGHLSAITKPREPEVLNAGVLAAKLHLSYLIHGQDQGPEWESSPPTPFRCALLSTC